MRAVLITGHNGYEGVHPDTERPVPQPASGEVLVRITAAGVTPLEHAIATGTMPFAAPPPLVLGSEAAGVIVESAEAAWRPGDRVMFTGPYGLLRDGTWAEYVAVEAGHLARVPDGLRLTVAASLPVAYLTAYLALRQAGFTPGMSVLAPGIGGSVGNATYQVARALGAGTVLSTTSNAAKAETATAAGYNVITLSDDNLAQQVLDRTGGRGVDVVVDGLGSTITAQALSCVAFGGSVVTLGYSAGRQSTVTLTDLIWKGATLQGFSLLLQPPDKVLEAYRAISDLVGHGAIAPVVNRVVPLDSAADGLRYLIEDRPFGKVVLAVAEDDQ